MLNLAHVLSGSKTACILSKDHVDVSFMTDVTTLIISTLNAVFPENLHYFFEPLFPFPLAVIE